MELAIAAGIAYLGYRVSGAQARAPPPSTPAPRRAGQQPPSELLAADRAAAAARWDAAADPRVSGIITPHTNPGTGPLPFFRSAKSQNTNDAVKQTRLELFTGATETDASATGTWQHKAVSGPRFAPAETAARVTSDGRPGNAQLDLGAAAERFRLTPKMNNVLPVQQLRVGPGVGVGAQVAATDGFHPMFRVLPSEDSLGSYRKSQLPGGMVAGKAAVDAREGEALVAKNRAADRFYEQSARPDEPAGAAHLRAQRVLPRLPRDPNTRRAHEHYVGGGAARAGSALGTPGAESRGRDRTAQFPVVNAAAAAGTAGAAGHYTRLTLDAARYDSQQREAAPPGVVNARGAVPAGEAFGAADLPPTQRNLTGGFPLGGGGTRVGGGAARPLDAPGGTLRQTLHGGGAVLAGAAGVPATRQDNDQRQGLEREAKRAGQLTGRLEVGGRMNVLDPGAVNVGARRAGGRDARVASHGAGLPRGAGLADLGQPARRGGSMATPENPWVHDLGLAARQLESNDVALPSFAPAN